MSFSGWKESRRITNCPRKDVVRLIRSLSKFLSTNRDMQVDLLHLLYISCVGVDVQIQLL